MATEPLHLSSSKNLGKFNFGMLRQPPNLYAVRAHSPYGEAFSFYCMYEKHLKRNRISGVLQFILLIQKKT